MSEAASHATVLEALALRHTGQFDEALALLLPLLDSPDLSLADRTLALDIAAISSLGLRRTQDAEDYWRRAILIAPDGVDAHANLAVMLKGLGRYAEAEPLARHRATRRPESADAHFDLAWILFRLNRHEESAAEYRDVLRILPDAAEAHNNLGNVLEVLDELEQAETHVRMALSLNPELAEAHYNLGSLMRHASRFDDAQAAYRRALELRPDYPDASFALATLLLSNGQFDEGWMRYESRYTHPVFVHRQSKGLLQCPQWNGESLAGKALLVWQEDGLGDMIQFARYVPMLKAAGARHITIACVSALQRLLASVDGVDAVVDHDTAQTRSAHFDCWTSLLSAPFHFDTTLTSLPDALRIRAEPAWTARLHASLDTLAGTFKVGLVWKGNPGHHNDAKRSLPSLAVLAPLWTVPSVGFVSLQKGAGEDEAQNAPPTQPIVPLGSSLADLADSAAVIAQLDLLICVDTSVAHLAASMGKPCWIMLPARDVDWRWMHERDDSPWYPHIVRLFRQREGEAWRDVVERCRNALTLMRREHRAF
jgi:tetratricopeptide (TPR) repeat protein